MYELVSTQIRTKHCRICNINYFKKGIQIYRFDKIADRYNKWMTINIKTNWIDIIFSRNKTYDISIHEGIYSSAVVVIFSQKCVYHKFYDFEHNNTIIDEIKVSDKIYTLYIIAFSKYSDITKCASRILSESL